MFLAGTDVIQAQAIQGLPTVRSPVDPSSSSSSISSTTTSETLSELKRPASVGPGGLQRTPSSSSLKLANRNSITASQNASSESLVEKRGTSKGRGRVLKVLGDLNLLCGIVPGAIAQYTQSVEILRLTTDYLWHASALEGVGMALVLLSYLKVEYSVIPGGIEETDTPLDTKHIASKYLFNLRRTRKTFHSNGQSTDKRCFHRSLSCPISLGYIA